MNPRSTHRPLAAAFAAVVVLASLLLTPSIGSAAGEAQQLERTKQQLAEIKKRLAAARHDAHKIETEVEKLDSQIADLNRQIKTGEHDISALESDIRTAEAQIAELEQKYIAAQTASNQRARELYMRGPVERLGQLLEADNFGEFIRMSMWWEVAAELDGKTMLGTTRLKGEMAERKASLSAIRDDLSQQKQWLESRKALVAEARTERNAALQSVKAEIAEHEKHVKELEAASRQLTAVLRSSLSRSSGAVSTSGFIWPLRNRVTSEYGYRRGGFHSGMDIDGNTGDPVVAAKSGVISGVTCGSGYGICTIVDHGNGVATLYAHFSRKAVFSGSVQQGQVIGYVGCTGSCTGSHLHFEVRVNGSPQNPRKFLP